MEEIIFTKAFQTVNADTAKPHSHDFFELHFLLSGDREIFIENKLFLAEKNTLIVFPPYKMYRTGGGAYSYIDVCVPPSALTAEEWDILSKIAEYGAVDVNPQHLEIIRTLLIKGAELQTLDDSIFNAQDALKHFAKLIIFYLSMGYNRPLPSHEEKQGKKLNTDVLRITQYLEEHYAEPVTLIDVCEHFYLSKATLCSKFKKYMSCSVKDYLLEIRLKNAKQQLRTTQKSIEEIAVDCGFTSANYFRAIFKSSMGESPLKYRKAKRKTEV